MSPFSFLLSSSGSQCHISTAFKHLGFFLSLLDSAWFSVSSLNQVPITHLPLPCWHLGPPQPTWSVTQWSYDVFGGFLGLFWQPSLRDKQWLWRVSGMQLEHKLAVMWLLNETRSQSRHLETETETIEISVSLTNAVLFLCRYNTQVMLFYVFLSDISCGPVLKGPVAAFKRLAFVQLYKNDIFVNSKPPQWLCLSLAPNVNTVDMPFVKEKKKIQWQQSAVMFCRRKLEGGKHSYSTPAHLLQPTHIIKSPSTFLETFGALKSFLGNASERKPLQCFFFLSAFPSYADYFKESWTIRFCPEAEDSEKYDL